MLPEVRTSQATQGGKGVVQRPQKLLAHQPIIQMCWGICRSYVPLHIRPISTTEDISGRNETGNYGSGNGLTSFWTRTRSRKSAVPPGSSSGSRLVRGTRNQCHLRRPTTSKVGGDPRYLSAVFGNELAHCPSGKNYNRAYTDVIESPGFGLLGGRKIILTADDYSIRAGHADGAISEKTVSYDFAAP